MRQCQRKFCRDVSVLRRADCWTDHKLLRAKLLLTCGPPVSRQHIRRRFAVYKLCDGSVCSAYVDTALMKIRSEWGENMSADQKWAVLKDGLLEAGMKVLGTDSRCQPD